MKAPPLITIGLTCYNAQDSIGRAIESALAQTWDNLEILVVDDCSSDNSVPVIKAYNQVRLVQHTENTGPGGARQSLLNEAKGEFLAFFDDDDVSLPRRISEQYARIVEYEKNSGVELIACYASGERVYPNGHTLPLKAIGRHPVVPNGPSMAERILYFGGYKSGWCYGGTPSCALMARTQTFRAVGGFDHAFRRIEDLDFAVRLALAGGHFIGCADKLFIQYATNAEDKSYQKNLEAEMQLAEKHKPYLQEKNRFYYALNWPLLRYYHFKRHYIKFCKILCGLLLRYPLQVSLHLLRTGPLRLMHERRISRKSPA